MRGVTGSRHAPVALLGAGLTLLVLAWVFANPPGAAPDEGRTTCGRSARAGCSSRAPRSSRPRSSGRRSSAQAGKGEPLPGAGLATVLWAAKQTRAFDVPLALSVTTFGCNDRSSEVSAACLDKPPAGPQSRRVPTYTGTYAPFVYIVPGAAMRTQDSPAAALRAGRLVSALTCLALLIAAIALTGGGVALAGMAVALTPMVVYCASILNASGPEIAGSLCFIAAGLRLQRPGAGPWAWAALAAGGAALTLSRSLGPVAAGRAGRDAAPARRRAPAPAAARARGGGRRGGAARRLRRRGVVGPRGAAARRRGRAGLPRRARAVAPRPRRHRAPRRRQLRRARHAAAGLADRRLGARRGRALRPRGGARLVAERAGLVAVRRRRAGA